MPKKHVLGWHIFIPLEKNIKHMPILTDQINHLTHNATINKNFYTQNCDWCGRLFHSKKHSRYCCASHKASAGRKRKEKNHLQEIKQLQDRIKELESKQ